MENVIKIETDHKHYSLEIEIDNSTEVKDFNAEKGNCGGQLHQLFIKKFEEDGQVVVEINKIPLRGREVELLKEFLNQ